MILTESDKRKFFSKRATNKLIHNEINYLILFGSGSTKANKLVELSMYYAEKIRVKGI